MNVNNIYCVGRNYAKHAYELGNEIPEEMILFTKPTHALIVTKGQGIKLPKGMGDIHHELEIVLKIDRKVEKGDKVEDVVGGMALGLDLTLRDVQSSLKEKGRPWLRAKGFKNSAVTTPFWTFEGADSCEQVDFSLVKNGEVVQKGNSTHMLFNFQTIIDECAENFGLGEGDLIYTGTPEGVGSLLDGDECILYWGAEEKGRFFIE